MIGSSNNRKMSKIWNLAKRVANTTASVFITGETGTGKEIVSKYIHDSSDRKSEPFVAVNCAALPRELIESELFGSVKGAFTSSIRDRDGLFLQADNGTILLDELAEMPLDTQGKLLRVLEERRIRPVGGDTSRMIDCRVIAATNVNPQMAIKEGKLRSDLYYRLAVINIEIPPLRERTEDIGSIAQFLLTDINKKEDRYCEFDETVVPYLNQKTWEGNIRQLKNEIHHAVIMSEDDEITSKYFPGNEEDVLVRYVKEEFTRTDDMKRLSLLTERQQNQLKIILSCTISKAAELLKSHINTVKDTRYRITNKLGISRELDLLLFAIRSGLIPVDYSPGDIESLNINYKSIEKDNESKDTTEKVQDEVQ